MNYQSLLYQLGPCPTLYRVSLFLGEPFLGTWRHVQNGELEVARGGGKIRITLKSLCTFLSQKTVTAKTPAAA